MLCTNQPVAFRNPLIYMENIGRFSFPALSAKCLAHRRKKETPERVGALGFFVARVFLRSETEIEAGDEVAAWLRIAVGAGAGVGDVDI